MSTRPKYVPASIPEDKVSEFSEQAKKAISEGAASFKFEGKTYALKKKVSEAVFKGGGRYVFSGPIKFKLQYNDNHGNDDSEWISFIQDHVNGEVPEDSWVINWGNIDPEDYNSDGSENQDRVEQIIREIDQWETLVKDPNSNNQWIVADRMGSELEDKISEINKLLPDEDITINSGDDSDTATLIWTYYFEDKTIPVEKAINSPYNHPDDFDDFDESKVENHLEKMKSDFNESKLEQYSKIPGVKSIRFESYEHVGRNWIWNIVVESDKKLESGDVDKVRSFLSGQMSDGWGEGAEQRDTEISLADGFVNLDISFWDPKSAIKLTAEGTIDSDLKTLLKKAKSTALKLFKSKVDTSGVTRGIKSIKKKIGHKLSAAGKKLAESSSLVEARIKASIKLKTDGKGLWNDIAKDVKITGIDLVEPVYGIVNVYFDTSTWDVQKNGLIYTDKTFLKGLNDYLKSLGFSVKLSYTEQGMQGLDYVSLETDSGKESIFADEFAKILSK